MAKKSSLETRERLERLCLSILDSADLGKAVPLVKRFKRNTLVEINRLDAFFRLYITDELRCSVRMSTPAFKARRDNFALYSPHSLATETEMRRVLEEEVMLGRTLEAISAAAILPDHSPEWVPAHLDPWLAKWCDPGQKPCGDAIVELKIRIDQSTFELLRELAFVERKSTNAVASKIVSSHVESWEPTGDDAKTLARIRSLARRKA